MQNLLLISVKLQLALSVYYNEFLSCIVFYFIATNNKLVLWSLIEDNSGEPAPETFRNRLYCPLITITPIPLDLPSATVHYITRTSILIHNLPSIPLCFIPSTLKLVHFSPSLTFIFVQTYPYSLNFFASLQ